MTTTTIRLAAFVAETERPTINVALARLTAALEEASGHAVDCACQFVQAATDAPAGSILVASLGREVECPEPWPETEARLRALYAGLGERGDPVFICTVLRHTGDLDTDDASRRRVRIRRLNLLAADISRESGAFVIDIDRVLADIGAGRLGTDYRLGGDAAADLAGRSIAAAIIGNGLDDHASFEVLDAAKAMVTRDQTEIARPPVMGAADLVAIGRGRRRQLVAPVVAASPDVRSAWFIRQVLNGRIGFGSAVRTFGDLIGRRGFEESMVMLVSGLVRLIGKRA